MGALQRISLPQVNVRSSGLCRSLLAVPGLRTLLVIMAHHRDVDSTVGSTSTAELLEQLCFVCCPLANVDESRRVSSARTSLSGAL